MTIRILIADDHKIMRDGLRALLAREPGMEVVAEASNGRIVVELAEEHQPDVIVMDISMPEANGIDAAQKILAKNPSCKILALSMHTDRRFVEEMLQAGASGYLPKDCAHGELAEAIRQIISGRNYLSPTIEDMLGIDGRRHPDSPTGAARELLTARELEVLQLLAEGKSTKIIAFDLDISVKTVETYRQKIQTKLGLRSVAELTKYAVREGLTSLEF